MISQVKHMLYKTAPIIKYMLLLGIFYLFFKNYKSINYDSYIHVVVFFIFCIIALDLIIIKNHPQLFDDKDIKVKKDDEEDDTDEEIIILNKNKKILNKNNSKKYSSIQKKNLNKKKEEEYDDDDTDTDFDTDDLDD